ncbi:MAG: leucyl aminopeptidase [Pontimonas sp.]|jgi:leucyl aminopeptidase
MTPDVPTLLTSLDDLAASDVLVVGVSKTKEGPSLVAGALDAELRQALSSVLGHIDADGSPDSTWRVPSPQAMGASSVLLVGLGEGALDADRLRLAAGFAAQSVTSGIRLVFALPYSTPGEVEAIVEGAVLGSHRVTKISGEKKDNRPSIAILGELPGASLARIMAECEAVWLVRDLVAMPPNLLNPISFVSEIEAHAKNAPLSIEILDEKRLEDEGYGGITSVGKGSINPPRLMILRYQPPAPTRHIALVGKGITFDSGGLSLKSPTGMVGMKYDMTGAAVMAAATLAAAHLGSPAAITTYLCLAENMPSGTAARPNDVITIRGGKTVEILNTDAEGRLVMADGLQAASALSPDLILDVATLTGAARIALGERYAGLMGTDSAVAEVQHAASSVGELVWHMPLPAELRAILTSDVADIANVKPGEVLGGMLSAAQFLKDFVGTQESGDLIPWAHLDIAGPAANSSGPYGYTPKGPTGAITRTVLSVLMN